MTADGILDIGKHCHYCRNVDFLPFDCADCGYEFCAKHRYQHECERAGRARNESKDHQVDKQRTDKNGGKPKVSDIDLLFQEAKQPKSYELDKLRRERYNQTKDDKLIKLKNGKSDTLGNLKSLVSSQTSLFKMAFGSSASAAQTTSRKKPANKKTSNIVNLSRIRNDKELKGDTKVQSADRIYVWVYLIPNDKTSMNDGLPSSLSKQLQKPFEKKAVFISKNWPVGKAVDTIAALFKIKNENGKSSEFTYRLNLFKSVDSNSESEPLFEFNDDSTTFLKPSSRVSKEIQNGDTLHLIRGADVSRFS